jgi:hypothetical protein
MDALERLQGGIASLHEAGIKLCDFLLSKEQANPEVNAAIDRSVIALCAAIERFAALSAPDTKAAEHKTPNKEKRSSP